MAGCYVRCQRSTPPRHGRWRAFATPPNRPNRHGSTRHDGPVGTRRAPVLVSPPPHGGHWHPQVFGSLSCRHRIQFTSRFWGRAWTASHRSPRRSQPVAVSAPSDSRGTGDGGEHGRSVPLRQPGPFAAHSARRQADRPPSRNIPFRREHAAPDVVWLTTNPEPARGTLGLDNPHYDKFGIRFTVRLPKQRCTAGTREQRLVGPVPRRWPVWWTPAAVCRIVARHRAGRMVRHRHGYRAGYCLARSGGTRRGGRTFSIRIS